jgi:hypothetical protein
MHKQLFSALLFLTITSPAFPQGGDSSQPQPIQIGSVTLSGSVRERVEVWEWFAGRGQNGYTFSGTLAQFSLSQTSPGFDWKFTLAAPILLGLPRGAVQPAPQGQLGLGGSYYASNYANRYAALVFPKQAYIRFKHEGSSVQIGRFEFADGTEVTPADRTLAAIKRDRVSQRLIANFGFSTVQRSFDGVNGSVTNGPWNFTAVGAVPTRGVFQVDGWGWVKTPFAYAALTRQLHYSKGNSAEWRLFGIYYDDTRSVLKTDNRSAAARAADTNNNIRIGTYGGHYIQAIQTRAGTIDLVAWGAAQTGSWGTLSQRATAGTLEAGIQPKVLPKVRPWLRGGYYYGSGDGNPNDRTNGTFFALLPTPRAYARFPFFNEMNNKDGFVEIIMRPSKTVTLRTDVHHLSLASKNDLWYLGGGAFQPWTFGYQGRPSNGKSSLANLYDASIDYAFHRAASIGFYYGFAQGGDVMKAIYRNANGQLGFIELNYRF